MNRSPTFKEFFKFQFLTWKGLSFILGNLFISFVVAHPQNSGVDSWDFTIKFMAAFLVFGFILQFFYWKHWIYKTRHDKENIEQAIEEYKKRRN